MDGRILRRVADVRRLRLGSARRHLAELTRTSRAIAADRDAAEAERLAVLTAGQQTIRSERDALFRDSFRVSDMQALRATAEAVAARAGILGRRIDDLTRQHAAIEEDRSKAARALLSMQRKCDVIESTGRALVVSETLRKVERVIEGDWSVRRESKGG